MDNELCEKAKLSKEFSCNYEVKKSLGVCPELKDFIGMLLKEHIAWSVTYKGVERNTQWVPGSTLLTMTDSNISEGPQGPSEVMLLFDWPKFDVSGPALSPWVRTLEAILEHTGITGYRNWYATPCVKFAPELFYTQSTIQKEWYMTCKPVLDQELRQVKPKYVICFGGPVAKMFMGVSKMNLEDALGQVYTCEYTFDDESKETYKVIVMPALRSLQENRGAARMVSLAQHQFSVLNNAQKNVTKKVPLHVIVNDATGLKKEVDRVLALAKDDPKRRIIAVDMEWEGDYPEQTGAKLLTLQFSSKPGEATVVVLHSQEGDFYPNQQAAVKELNRLLTWHDDWRPRVGGHFLRADLPWLMNLGICGTGGRDIRWSYAPTGSFRACKTDGGWDTSLMYHAYSEKESYGLKYLAAKELHTPRYEKELAEFLTQYRKDNKLAAADIHGFGCVPDYILHPYGAWDADVTRRLAELCMFGNDDLRELEGDTWRHREALLDRDAFGENNWKPYWLAHRASLGFLDIENTGLMLDKRRFAKLSELVDQSYEILLQHLRDEICWPDFNPKSTVHKQGLLFGREYAVSDTFAGKKCVMPETACSLNLKPEYATSTRMDWDKIAERGEEDMHSPAADKTVLNILSQSNKTVNLLKDVCKLKTAQSSPLSKPITYWDTQGEHTLYPNGLYADMHEDGAIHSHMRVLLATGRASSSKPNLQNIGKSAEADFQRILGYKDEEGEHGDYLDLLGGPRYLYPMRTVLRARPDCVLIESDFTGAELAVMAWISGDPAMIEHVRRNALPDSDPDYYDIHSHIAVKAFHLNCPPTKKGLAAIHKKHLRVAAKSVVFGYWIAELKAAQNGGNLKRVPWQSRAWKITPSVTT